jgi:mRNA interferase MazF
MRRGPSSSRLRRFRAISFSDLAQSKRRPAVVLADVGLDDLILRQITSNAFSDPSALEIDAGDFHVGSLREKCFARPGKLSTGHSSLISSVIGDLETARFHEILEAVVNLLLAGKQP